jgi:hypothetical protein
MPWVLEGEETVREGDTRIPSVVWEDFDTVSTAGTEAYVNGSSDSANLLSGSTTATGNTLTLPTITFPSGSGGITIVVEPAVSANSQTWKTGIIYRVLKPGSAR